MSKGIKLRNKIMSIILSAGLMLSIVPAIASPIVSNAGSRIVVGIGTDGIKAPESGENNKAWTGSYVWFGKYNTHPVKYRVLAPKTTDFADSPTLLLDCDTILFNSTFESTTGTNKWSDCSLNQKLNGDGFLNGDSNFTTLENAAISKTTVADDAKIFLLDLEDVQNTSFGYSNNTTNENINHLKIFSDSPVNWWIRTPAQLNDHNIIWDANYTVSGKGNLSRTYGSFEIGVSPALNIDLSSILYSTLASGSPGENGAVYKLTLIDNDLTIGLDRNLQVAAYGSTIAVPYSFGGNHGININQVSVMIMDKAYTAGNKSNAKMLYHIPLDLGGSLNSRGVGTFTMPKDLDITKWGSDYKVYLIAEDIIGGNVTDYASYPVEIPRERLDAEYKLWIGNVQVTDINKNDILDNGTVSYDSEANKLIFNNASLIGIIPTIEYKKTITINNQIQDLTISGKAEISGADIGINTPSAQITFEDADISLTGNFTGLNGNNVTIKNSKINTISKTDAGFDVSRLTVDGGTVIAETKSDDESVAIFAQISMTINSGEVSTYCDGALCSGIYTPDLTVNDGKLKVDSQGESCCGIMLGDKMTVNGGDINISTFDGYNGYSNGILGEDADIFINGGTLKVDSDYRTIYTAGKITLGDDMLIEKPEGATVSSDFKTVIESDGKSIAKNLSIRPLHKYTVTFDPNGGSGTMTEATATENKEYKLPDCTFTAPEGKEFDKWDKGEVGAGISVDGDTTIKAVWKDKPAEPTPTDDNAAPTIQAQDKTQDQSTETTMPLLKEVENNILNAKNDKDLEGSTFAPLKAKGVSKSNNSIKLSWTKVKNAKEYVIYGNKCGNKNKYTKIATVKGASYNVKKLKKGTYYKFIIVAVDGNNSLSVSKTIHATTKGGKKTNNTEVKLNKTKVKLKSGKSVKLKAKLKPGSKKVSTHRKLAWESDNPNVAKVNKSGKITSVGKGSCTIYAYAQNGTYAKIKVTVK